MKMNAKSTTTSSNVKRCCAESVTGERRSNQCKQPRNRIDQANNSHSRATLWGIRVLLLTATTTTT